MGHRPLQSANIANKFCPVFEYMKAACSAIGFSVPFMSNQQ